MQIDDLKGWAPLYYVLAKMAGSVFKEWAPFTLQINDFKEWAPFTMQIVDFEGSIT